MNVLWSGAWLCSTLRCEEVNGVPWVKVASVHDFPLNTMKQVVVDEDEIAVYRIDTGIYATSDYCTHASQLLTEGTLTGQIVACPKHGGKFDVTTGKATAFPCVIPLICYSVDVRGEEIWLNYE
jgi:3-phenylpropionate/trans-cinnamate dioxygenase ferredoxin component